MPKVKNTKHNVRIESLPQGFELIDGELVEKSHGGPVTGDQHNYGLTTFNPHTGESGGPKDTDVRYSLSSVPRDIANIEAEGGETVLTDLNNDGQFGLYDIKGPRHSSGGVPMFLPEQSFIFSDTQKMKMGKEMLADHGIKSRKKITPAKISKQYDLNKYYGILNDEYADKIQANTADLMLQKNKEGLSKLAFGQEMMKGFDEGLPLAAYPYVQSIGIDPFEFAERVKGLQQFTGDQQAQPMNEADMQAMNPMAAYGGGLPKAQVGGINPMQLQAGLNAAFPGQFPQQPNYGPMGPTPYQQQMINQAEQAKNDPASFFQNFNPQTFGQTDDYANIQNLGPDLDLQQNGPNRSPKAETPKGPNFATKLNRGIQGVMNSPGMNAFVESSKFATAGADWLNEHFKNAKGLRAEQDMLKLGMADNLMGTSFDPNMSQGVWDTNTGLIYDNMQGNPAAGGGFAGYKGWAQDGGESERLWKTGEQLDGGSDAWVDWYNSDENKQGRNERYETYKILAKQRGVKDEDLTSAEDFHNTYVNAQRQINAIQNYYKDDQDFLKTGDWDSSFAFKNGKKDYNDKRGKNWKYIEAIETINKKIREDNPDLDDDEIAKLTFTALDDAGIELFQEGYQAGQIMDLAGDELSADEAEYLKFVQGGVDDQTWTFDGKTYTISPVDSRFGNTTIGQWEHSTVPEYPCKPCPSGPDKGKIPERDENGNCPCGDCPTCPEGKLPGNPTDSDPCPCVDKRKTPEVPDPIITKAGPAKQPWIQDIIKSQAIADRERDMFLPWQPAVRRNFVDVALEDPTRQIAAINSQLAGQQEAIGAFAGPQSMAARNAQAQGQAVDAIANAVAGVNARNIGTLNTANQTNAQLESQFSQLEDGRRTKQYDDTMKTLQTYMDEKNFDREQYADSMANLITNMSNTYNMNQLYDYFNIDPLSGGDITQTGAKAFQPNPEQDKWAFMDNYMEAMKRAKAADLTDKDGNVDPGIVQALIAQSEGRGYSDPREEAWKQQGRQYMSGYGGYRKRGGEKKVKKWATPFYTGKMGM